MFKRELKINLKNFIIWTSIIIAIFLVVLLVYPSIINSDNIIMIDKGKIVAEGTHENLMRKSLKYQKLYKANLLKNTT